MAPWLRFATSVQASIYAIALERDTYFLANVAYLKGGRPVASFDIHLALGNGIETRDDNLYRGGADAGALRSPAECLDSEVHVRLQDGRVFWLKGQGPGQLRAGIVQRSAFWLRDKLEKAAVPME